jgi:hypothetical protein
LARCCEHAKPRRAIDLEFPCLTRRLIHVQRGSGINGSSRASTTVPFPLATWTLPLGGTVDAMTSLPAGNGREGSLIPDERVGHIVGRDSRPCRNRWNGLPSRSEHSRSRVLVPYHLGWKPPPRTASFRSRACRVPRAPRLPLSPPVPQPAAAVQGRHGFSWGHVPDVSPDEVMRVI